MGGIKTCPGANIVSDVMIGYDGGKSACHGTTAVITSAGGVVATHGIIESTVMWLGAIGAGCIWLP